MINTIINRSSSLSRILLSGFSINASQLDQDGQQPPSQQQGSTIQASQAPQGHIQKPTLEQVGQIETDPATAINRARGILKKLEQKALENRYVEKYRNKFLIFNGIFCLLILSGCVLPFFIETDIIKYISMGLLVVGSMFPALMMAFYFKVCDDDKTNVFNFGLQLERHFKGFKTYGFYILPFLGIAACVVMLRGLNEFIALGLAVSAAILLIVLMFVGRFSSESLSKIVLDQPKKQYNSINSLNTA